MATGQKQVTPFRGWVASLSNGQTVLEVPDVPGEKTAWQKLRHWCMDNGVHITQIRLQLGPINLIGLQDKECAGYCHAHQLQKNLTTGQANHFRGIGSVLDGQVYMIWVNLADGHIRPEVVPLADMAVHCVLKE